MKKKILSLVLAAVMLLTACGRQSAAGPEDDGSLRIVATTYPIYLLVNYLTQGLEGVHVEDLPVNDVVKEAVRLVTKDKSKDTYDYYQEISENAIATMVKLLDRCNNVSGMSAAFSKEKLVKYINETEEYVYPLLQTAKTRYSEYSNQVFLIKYHMTSVVTSLKYQLIE